MRTTKETLQKIYDRHDIFCNQKYDTRYPYSLHLRAVVAQVYKYGKAIVVKDYDILVIAAAGHDLIEDARLTYNDVVSFVGGSPEIADIIYACTELRGHNRNERHGEEYFNTLKENRLAVFIKLCDIIANVLYSMLTKSSMYDKYQKEFPLLYKNLHIVGEFEELWDDLRDLLKM